MRHRRKKAKKTFFTKKKLVIFGISLAVILIGFVIVLGFGGIFTGYENDSEMVEPVDKETGKVNILLAGRDYSGSCTDTIMVVSYDLDDNNVNILSIPRDTRMYIGNRYQKINAAYSISKDGNKKGIQGTIEAVTRLTAIPINYYVEFTFEAFRNSIDALGGVDFYVPQNMNYDDPYQELSIHLKEGQQHLDGDKAEQLVRFRRYPMGDIDRVKVQQNFIKTIADQKLNLSIITKLPELFDVVKKDIKTNLNASDITKYALNLQDLTGERVYMYTVPGVANSTDYGASYWICDMPALATLIEETFGYDATNITIHSKDGSSKSKDVKIVTESSSTPKPTEKPKKTDEPEETKKPASSPEATKKPTQQTPKPEKTNHPSPTATQKPTETPVKTPEVSKEPVKTPEPTVAPEKTKEPEQEGIKRPGANS